MWKNTHSEMELQSEDGAEMELDEELSMKYSSDITLCVNPCLETNSLEQLVILEPDLDPGVDPT